MKTTIKNTLAASALALLSACGGGSGSAPIGQLNLSGTVAMGAPMALGTVEIYDSRGQLAGTTTTDASGAYSLTNIDMTRFSAPFTIKAIGQVGDSTTTLVSVSSGGTANVNQITNAIAANLSADGNPITLSAGNSLTSTTISAAVNAYSAALSTVVSSFNATSDLISGTFNSNYDALLDNVNAQVLPNGQVVLGTSEGQALTDLLGEYTNGQVATAGVTLTQLSVGQLPAANASNNLPAPTSVLSANNLQALLTKLNSCFALPAASRATQSATSGNPVWILATDCDGLATSDFKHNGYYWIDSTSSCVNNNTYCLGMFGYMLTNAAYDNLQFLTPTTIRGVSQNKWYVKFPIKYSDNSIGQLGDSIGGNYIIASYDPTSQKYKFSGNQRDASTYAEPVVQKIKNINTGSIRYETGLNLYVNAYSVRSISTGVNKKYVVKAVVKGRGLPVGGVYFANKLNRAATASIGVTSSTASTYNVCGGYLNIEFPSVITTPYLSTTPNAAGCAGVIRLAYNDNPVGSYTPSASVPSYMAGWNSGNYLTDNELSVIKTGEPYTFELTYSDGTIRTYVNRVSYPVLTMDSVVKVNFPAINNTDFDAFNGSLTGNDTYTVGWDQLGTSQVFSAALYWSKGLSATSNNRIPIGRLTQSLDCTATGSPACKTGSSWINAGSTPDSGTVQVRSRTIDGLQIYSQLRQY